MSDSDAIARVERLHAPRSIDVLTGDCAVGECGHEDECPTTPIQQCADCGEFADAINSYYLEEGVGATLWPCATIRALRGEDQ